MIKNLFILSISLLCLTVGGCDKKRGCTNPFSDNFDPDAVEDDDTCIPKRDKFVGSYDGFGTIEIGPDTLVSYEQVGITLEDLTVDNEQELILGISNFDAQLYALTTTVTGSYDLLVNYQEIGVYAYWGDGVINGRVLELYMTRTEEITLPDETTYKDTIILNLHGLKELE